MQVCVGRYVGMEAGVGRYAGTEARRQAACVDEVDEV